MEDDPHVCGMCERPFTDAEMMSDDDIMIIGVMRKRVTRMEPVHKLCVMINVLGVEQAQAIWGAARN